MSSTSSSAPLAQMLDDPLGEGELSLAATSSDFAIVDTRAPGSDDGREADEDRAVAQLGLEQVREREGETRLACPAGAGERDEPRTLVAIAAR